MLFSDPEIPGLKNGPGTRYPGSLDCKLQILLPVSTSPVLLR